MALISYDNFNIDSQILRKLEEGYTSRKIKEYFKQHGAMPDSGVVETFTIPSSLMEEYKQFFYAKEYKNEIDLEKEIEEENEGGSKVLLFYEAGFNSLSDDFVNNINAIKNGFVPLKESNKILLILSHLTSSHNNYSVDTEAVLTRLYVENDTVVEEIVATLPIGMPIANAEIVTAVFELIADLYPNDGCSVVFSSHASGWLPGGYTVDPIRLYDEVPRGKITLKSWGQEYLSGGTRWTEVEIKDLAAAVPYKLDYIIFDACLMSTVEVAWEFKDKCKYLIASPCEIPADGFDYSTISRHLIKPSENNTLQAICNDYFEKYADSVYGCAITAIDCDNLQPLADTCRTLFSKYRTEIRTLSGANVQTYDRLSGNIRYHAFFDLKDMIREAGATDEEISTLQSALTQSVVYELHTNKFIDTNLKRCCGLSTYLPADPAYSETTYHGTQFLDGWYKTNLKWNTATGFIQ